MENQPPADIETSNILWHPAFFEALKLELEPYQDALEFIPEYQLTTGPLQIDVVVIKKVKDIVINKNIAAIFRKINLLEYKSPGDYVSVKDFYKVYAYACLYVVLNKDVSISDLTVSFVKSGYPKDLISHLQEARGFTVENKTPGIYTVSGDILPIQIIDSRELSEDENLWLKDLSDRLDLRSAGRIAAEVDRSGKAGQLQAYLDAIGQANWEIFEEVLKMSNGAMQLERIFTEAGFIARAEARGEERKSLKIAENLLAKGFSVEQAAELAELDIEKVRELH